MTANQNHMTLELVFRVADDINAVHPHKKQKIAICWCGRQFKYCYSYS